MIEAGETGGILDIILQRLATYVEKAVRLEAAVKSALIYPVAVVSMAFLIVGALLKWVVPIFANLFAGLGVNLPLPTRIVMGLSGFVQTFWWMFVRRRRRIDFRHSIRFASTHEDATTLTRCCSIFRSSARCCARSQSAASPVRWEPDHLGRADSRRLEHHRQDFRQRRAGRGADEGSQGNRRRPHDRRSACANAASSPTW